MTDTSSLTVSPGPRSPRRRKLVIAAALAGAGLVVAGTVHAAFDRPERFGTGRFDRQARAARLCANDTARYHPVVRAFVRADLRLDQGQAAQFERLADLVLPGLEDLKREVCNDFTARSGPTPERLAELAANLRKAADLAEKALEPSRSFYASLSPEQRERVDDLASRRRARP